MHADGFRKRQTGQEHPETAQAPPPTGSRGGRGSAPRSANSKCQTLPRTAGGGREKEEKEDEEEEDRSDSEAPTPRGLVGRSKYIPQDLAEPWLAGGGGHGRDELAVDLVKKQPDVPNETYFDERNRLRKHRHSRVPMSSELV
ncbi:unnamed protein product [Prorocentrum cordatum]|uniref:Ribosome biogenesis protein NOP53 n=1 Tax=Prorocentrum cordatum TaxID=2364126 RepID=A0ABN9V2G4_9DINO|nr:unnamed protein product [Polarella glacialis]